MNQKKLAKLDRWTPYVSYGGDELGMTLTSDGAYVKFEDVKALLETDKSEGEFDQAEKALNHIRYWSNFNGVDPSNLGDTLGKIFRETEALVTLVNKLKTGGTKT